MFHLTFENPLYLICLFLIPALIFIHFYLLKNSEGKALRFANFESLKGVTGKKLITKNIWLLIIRISVLCCIIIAASGMIIWYETDISESDFIIAIDISPSMSAKDILPSRIDVAKQISSWLVNNSGHSNIGIVSFSGLTFIDSTPITNKNSLLKTIQNIQIKMMGGTDISGALITSTNLLLSSEKSKTIILIGDGSDTASSFISEGVEQSVNYAKNNHIIIHSIGLGTKSGLIGYLPDKYNLSTTYNEDILKHISNSTQGIFFDIKSLEEFKEPYINMVKKTEKGMVPFNLNRIAIILALILLFTEWILVNTRFRKIP